MKSMHVQEHAGHRKRLRGRFMKGGLAGFHDYEIIEYFLTFSISRKDVKPLAKNLIRTFKTVSGVMDAQPHELRVIPGMGVAAVSSVLFFRALLQHYLKLRTVEREWFPSTKITRSFLQGCLRGLKHEVFKVIFLNNQNRMIYEKTIQEGTVDRSAVYPREIIREALLNGASRLICAHNHPSGGVQPSAADQDITRELVYAAIPLGIDVLEHVIIAGDHYFSFCEAGYIETYYREYRHKESTCLK